MNEFESVFQKLATQELHSASLEDVKKLALAVWYEEFTPSFNALPQDDRSALLRAGYLLDRLLRYNCVSTERKKKLFAQVKMLREQVCPIETSMERLDPLAKSWELTQDLRHLSQDLLHYQTRHYH
ncbi:MAG: hypothetical protein R3E95_10795 [Thiolinea sp.]